MSTVEEQGLQLYRAFHLNVDASSPESERKRPPLVGAIVYAKGTQAVAAWDMGKGNLIVGHTNKPDIIELMDIRSTRILSLPGYDNVHLAQIGLASAAMTQDTALTIGRTDIRVEIFYTNPQTGDNELYYPDDQELMYFMANEPPRIAPFFGEGPKEEDALVFHMPASNQKNALVLLVQPEQSQYINTLKGVEYFYNTLNALFIDLAKRNKKALDPRVVQVVNELDAMKSRGDLQDIDAWIEIYKARLIGHSRLAIYASEDKEKTRHAKLLEEELMNVLPPPDTTFDKFKEAITRKVPVFHLRNIETAIRKVVLSSFLTDNPGDILGQGETLQAANDVNTMIRTRHFLKPYEIIHKLDDYFGMPKNKHYDDPGEPKKDFVAKVMEEYFLRLMELVPTATTENEYNELQYMIDELYSTDFVKNKEFTINGYSEGNVFDRKNYYDYGPYQHSIKAEAVLDQVQRYINTKIVQLQSKDMIEKMG